MRKPTPTTAVLPGGETPVVVVYASNPEISTSVPLIGFRIVSEMTAQYNAHVVAHRRDREALLRAIPDGDFTFVGPVRLGDIIRRITERLFPGRWGLISIFDFPDYALFDVNAYWALRRLSRQEKISYALRVNPVSFRFPSILPYLPIPVITGPHNGGMDWPEGFRHIEAVEGDSTGHVRLVGDFLHHLVGDSGRYAQILVANEQCAQTVPPAARRNVSIMSENGVSQLPEPSRHRGDARRILFVGRLNPFKAADIALRAVSRLPDDVTLTVVGDGTQRETLEQLADALGIRHRVTFIGHVSHDDVSEFYSQAGVFLFPSVRESGGGVVLEAMSYGLPCVVSNWGGPAVYTKDVGVQCRVDNPQVLEDDLVATLQRFLSNPDEARAIGDASRGVVAREYLWPGKVRRMQEIALASRGRWMAERGRWAGAARSGARLRRGLPHRSTSGSEPRQPEHDSADNG